MKPPHLRGGGASAIGHLVLVNAFVGAMVGLERTVLPLLAEADFGIASKAATLAFIASFGVSKAVVNALAGALSDRWGRKRLLVVGWLVGIPVPVLIIVAPSWGWVLGANVLLGVNQALTWSMTVIMKVDLVAPRRYGLVIGLNEFSGYAGMALAAAATGWVASEYGLRPEPFELGIGLALVGLLLSLAATETHPSAGGSGRPEGSGAAERPSGSEAAHRADGATRPSFGRVLRRSAWADAHLSAASVSGLATNLKDGVLWGLLPIVLISRGVSLEGVGTVAALYPLVWAGSQLVFGPLSDRVGRRGLITGGMIVQGAGVALFAQGVAYPTYLVAAAIVGLGTGMVYPTLLAFVSEAADPAWRATALGVYRFWRDLGYAVGALGGGVLADRLGTSGSLSATAAVGLLAGLFFLVRAR